MDARAAQPLRFGHGLPLIAVSEYGQLGDRVHSLAVGFDCHMGKPVDPQPGMPR